MYRCNCGAVYPAFRLLIRHVSQFEYELAPYRPTSLHNFVRAKFTETKYVCVETTAQFNRRTKPEALMAYFRPYVMR